MNEADEAWMRRALSLASESVRDGGGPFGAVVVRDGELVAGGRNRVVPHGDPTAHAEVQAIRAACRELGTHLLSGCTLYSSCEPCPMCLSATYWARIDRLVFACRRGDAAAIGFDDEFLYEELGRTLADRRVPTGELLREEGLRVFRAWEATPEREMY